MEGSCLHLGRSKWLEEQVAHEQHAEVAVVAGTAAIEPVDGGAITAGDDGETQ